MPHWTSLLCNGWSISIRQGRITGYSPGLTWMRQVNG